MVGLGLGGCAGAGPGRRRWQRTWSSAEHLWGLASVCDLEWICISDLVKKVQRAYLTPAGRGSFTLGRSLRPMPGELRGGPLCQRDPAPGPELWEEVRGGGAEQAPSLDIPSPRHHLHQAGKQASTSPGRGLPAGPWLWERAPTLGEFSALAVDAIIIWELSEMAHPGPSICLPRQVKSNFWRYRPGTGIS